MYFEGTPCDISEAEDAAAAATVIMVLSQRRSQVRWQRCNNDLFPGPTSLESGLEDVTLHAGPFVSFVAYATKHE